MYSEHPSIWFHGTNKRFLDDQLREYGEYVGVIRNGQFGEERDGIYLAENRAGVSLVSAIKSAREYDSAPILLISSSEVIRERLRTGNTCMKIYCGWPAHLFLKMDVPIIDMNDDFGYNEEQFKDELRKLFDKQTLFTVPKRFDWDRVTEYFGWA